MNLTLNKQRSTKFSPFKRLPSKLNKQNESTISYSNGLSCPNSPVIKKIYRLVVVGSARTGKTSIVNRFLEKNFEDRYLPTIENFHRKLYKTRGEIYQLDILDRSGNDPFPASRKLSYLTGDMFILVSAVDHAESVEQMFEIYSQIIECKSNLLSTVNKVPIVFVLNKTDLSASKWQITINDVDKKVSKFLLNDTHESFIPCSAALNENIIKIFNRLFTIGKLPKHMNSEMHKMLQNKLSVDRITNDFNNLSTTNFKSIVLSKKHVLQRMRSKFSKESDDEVIIDVYAKRPSLRTDLLINRAKFEGISVPAIYQATTTALYVANTGHSKTLENNKYCIIS